jgi:hypothetical protein
LVFLACLKIYDFGYWVSEVWYEGFLSVDLWTTKTSTWLCGQVFTVSYGYAMYCTCNRKKSVIQCSGFSVWHDTGRARDCVLLSGS